MPLPVEQLVKQLQDSEILSSETLKDFIPPKANPKSAEDLARQLVQKKQLTRFQASEAYQGKAKSLVLGSYVILDKIGAGGMGQVFKAEHRRMKRVVALKMLPAAVMKDEMALKRFEREVTAAARLEHPNIVTAYDAAESHGVHFLVMQYVEGADLSALVKKNGPFPLGKAANYILQAARGLEYAHKHGVIHRDIKPANLLLSSEGTVKILDMGLARIDAEADTAAQAELTGTGAVMGTVDYMAPEQAMSTKNADARADIYSLGIAFYYLVAGRPPYDGETVMAKLLAHREAPIPALRNIEPTVSEQLEATFRKMVAKKPEDRHQSVSEVVADLERCQSSSDASLGASHAPPVEADENLLTFLRDIPSSTTLKPAVAKTPAGPTSKGRKLLLYGAGLSSVLVVLVAAGLLFKSDDAATINELKAPEARPARPKTTLAAQPARRVRAWETPGFQAWVKQVQALPAADQGAAVAKKLAELNPGFDAATVKAKLREGAVNELQFKGDRVYDLSPVRALSRLQSLGCSATPGTQSPRSPTSKPPKDRLGDLSPLEGMKLKTLSCSWTGVTDLSPLKGMPLKTLQASSTWISDLTPLEGMPLTSLSCSYTLVSDLSPVRGLPLEILDCSSTTVWTLAPLVGMPLKSLRCGGTNISDLSPLADLPLTFLNIGNTRVSTLEPLKKLKLTYLRCNETSISDLKPVRGMPLGDLYCESSQVVDLSPIAGMPLTKLSCTFIRENHSGLLRSIKTLKTVNDKPLAEFWKSLEVEDSAFRAWREDIADLPAEKQLAAVAKKLQELNPGFDGKVTSKIEAGVVTELTFVTDKVTDISPVRALTGLRRLHCSGSKHRSGKLVDLWPLRGTKLTNLTCASNKITDLTPLEGLKITALSIQVNPVSDLSPLAKMPLSSLTMNHTDVSDLSPLGGLHLKTLYSNDTPVADLSSLVDMKLDRLSCDDSRITDLSPLRSMPLDNIKCDFVAARDSKILQSIKTLKKINEKPAAEFWSDAENQQAAFDKWLKDVGALSPDKQVEAVAQKLVELNPDFDGKVGSKVSGGVVAELKFSTDNVTDISPVCALTGLRDLNCGGSSHGTGKLVDLSPLKGMNLSKLSCPSNRISDLRPLAGMDLRWLGIHVNPVSDVAPLASCTKLDHVYAINTRLKPEAVAALKKALPKCQVDWDGDPPASQTPADE